jgi:hypothetical protein
MRTHYHIVEPSGEVRLHKYVNRRQAEIHMNWIPGRKMLIVTRNALLCRWCNHLEEMSHVHS